MIVDNTEVVIEMDQQQFHCAMDVTMHFIGGKWKTVVLWYLRNDKKRFSELKAHDASNHGKDVKHPVKAVRGGWVDQAKSLYL